MSAEDFKNYAQAVQAIMVSLGVLIGGIWALVRLKLSREIEKARLEISRLERQVLEKKSLERSMELEVFSGNGKRIPAVVSVKLANNGSDVYVLDFRQPPLTISRIVPDPDGAHTFKEPKLLRILSGGIDGKELKPYTHIQSAATFLPSSSFTFYFYYEFPEEGAYCIDFVVPAPPSLIGHAKSVEADGLARQLDQERVGDPRWLGTKLRHSRIFVVERGNSKNNVAKESYQ